MNPPPHHPQPQTPPAWLKRVHRVLVFAVVASLAVTAAMWGLMLFMPDIERLAAWAVIVPGAIGVLSILLLTFATVTLRDRSPRTITMSRLGAAAAALGVLLLFGALLIESSRTYAPFNEAIARTGAPLLAIAVALACTISLRLVKGRSKLLTIVASLTMGAAWSAAGLLTVLMIGLDFIDGSDFGFVFAFAAVLAIATLATGVGNVVVPIMLVSKALKERKEVESIDPRLQVMLGCPKCGERQTLRPGFATCAKCRAGMFIEIEEPRCECGYLLYQLTGDACPECGRPLDSPGDVPPPVRTQ